MPVKVMNVDLRHPKEFATSGRDVYRAAMDMATWADEHGFSRIAVAEHHQNEDGYISCPLVFAAALGGCTRGITVRTGVVLAPLYHPIRLAEEVAVADLCLQGRLQLGLGLGVLPQDYRMFRVPFERRGRIMDELIPLLRTAWTGEPFEFEGQTVLVAPRPVQDPMPIFLGGISPAAADRAARLADGFHTATARIWDLYRDACTRHGKPDPGPAPARGPMFLWVTKEDKASVVERLTPHFRQQAESYAEQSRKAGLPWGGPWSPDPGEPSPYVVLHPDEAIELANGLGPDGELLLQPLLAGIPPAEAWAMLDLLDREVLPHLDH